MQKRVHSREFKLDIVRQVATGQKRPAQQHLFEQRLWALCQPYVDATVAQQTLSKQVWRFLPELFFEKLEILVRSVFPILPHFPAREMGESHFIGYFTNVGSNSLEKSTLGRAT